MPDRRLATLCLSSGNEDLAAFRRRLDHFGETLPLTELEVRLALPQASRHLHYVLGRLCPDGLPWQHTLLPQGIERFRVHAADGLSVACWCFPRALPQEAVLRWLWCDLPVRTESLVWIEERAALGENWWPELSSAFRQPGDVFGPLTWRELLAKDVEAARSQPWYRGVPFLTREGRPGVWAPQGEWAAYRVACLHQANIAETWLPRGVLGISENPFLWLSAMAQQLEWQHAEAPASAPRSSLP